MTFLSVAGLAIAYPVTGIVEASSFTYLFKLKA